MRKHTPGPWEWVNNVLFGSVAEMVVRNQPFHQTKPEDAALIAAAPDLLDALEELDERLRKCFAEPITAAEAYDSFYQEIVAAAIAKAEGK